MGEKLCCQPPRYDVMIGILDGVEGGVMEPPESGRIVGQTHDPDASCGICRSEGFESEFCCDTCCNKL